MGMLDKPGLDALIARGCDTCGSHRLVFDMMVDGLIPLMGGEPVGKLKWAYDGEAFCDGVFEVCCADCKARLFREECCTRCHAEGGLERALSTPNAYPVPLACPKCRGEEVRYIAFLPARTLYEGKRVDKAKTDVDIHDDGFHGYRVDCKVCATVSELRDRCPLCDAAGPLRERPR